MCIQTQLGKRLHLGPGESLELLADDALQVHLEHRRAGGVSLALTPPMAPEQLLTVVDAMGLALDLDRRLTPSRSLFRAVSPHQPAGPAPTAAGRRAPVAAPGRDGAAPKERQ